MQPSQNMKQGGVTDLMLALLFYLMQLLLLGLNGLMSSLSLSLSRHPLLGQLLLNLQTMSTTTD